MRVLIVNTSENTGGAAIAASRLMEALNGNGTEAKMLVRDKQTDRISVAALPRSPLLKAKFVWERACVWKANRFSRRNLFWTDAANTGTDITPLPEFKEADIVHLHWINQGFLSLKGIRRIIDSGKPVVWTMHDMWPFTGVCHHSGECERYKTECGRCPLLAGGGSRDLSFKVFRRKREMLRGARVAFVACSRWLEGLARQSALLTGQRITCIPNPVNTAVFRPEEQAEARRQCRLPAGKRLLLFGSFKVSDPRKGISYLAEACRILKERHPSLADGIGVIVAGNNAGMARSLFPFPAYDMGYVSDERRMARLYNAADAYVTPSLEDNLPNTVAEALSCGVPCVGFNVGGIPEMIGHLKNGYVARRKSAESLAEGVRWCLTEGRRAISPEAVSKEAAAKYSGKAVAAAYTRLYASLLEKGAPEG